MDLTAGADAGAALVRAVSPTLAAGERTHLDRRPIDLPRAVEQHRRYTELLERLGLELIWAEPAPGFPDAVFVEDAAVVAGGDAILTRPGAASRRGEIPGVAAALAGRLRVTELGAPARLDGGDVLRVGSLLYVGRSARTDAAGVRALAEAVEPMGLRVVPVPVIGCLHLKSGLTALPDGTFVAYPGWVDLRAVRAAGGPPEVLDVPAEEPAGADVLVVRGTVVVSAAAPRTAELVAGRGFPVETVDVGELELAEAGVTCMSVLLPSPAG